MSIPVKIGNQEILVFDITTDDIKINTLGNVSSATPEQSVQSLCITGECYQCNTSQCNEVQCTQKKCNQVKCNSVRCNTIKCGYTADNHCTACSNDN